MNDPVLNLLGLARRGGNIALGEEPVSEACRLKKAVMVFVAADTGDTSARRGARMAESAGVPAVTLPYTKEELGDQMGRASCALLAVTDRGLAAAVLQKLALRDPQFQPLAEKLAARSERRKHQAKSSRTADPSADR